MVWTMASMSLMLLVTSLPSAVEQQSTAPPAAAAEKKPERKRPTAILKPLVQQGRLSEAEVSAREMLAEAERDHGADSIEAADAIDAVAALMDLRDEVQGDEAVKLAQRAILIRERVQGSENPDVAGSVTTLANILWRKGDYKAARPLYERALEIRSNSPGVKPQTIARSLHNLAALMVNQGDYAAARPLAERSVSVLEASLGPDHDDLAVALNSQALLLKRMGDYAGSRNAYERALRIRSKSHGPESPGCADLMTNLGDLLNVTGEYAAARSLLESALKIQEKAHGSDNRVVADSLTNLGQALIGIGDFPSARQYLEGSLRIREKILDPAHTDLADSLHLLANTIAATGDLAGAAPLYQRALAIRENALGPSHPHVAALLNDLSRFQWAVGNPGDALQQALRAEKIAREQFEETARSLSERDALRYERIRQSGLGIALSLLATRSKIAAPPEDAGLVFNEVIRSRALVLDEMAGRRRALLLEHEAEVTTLARDLEMSRNRLASAVLRDSGTEGGQSYLERLERAQSEKEKIESELAQRSAEFRRRLNSMRVGLDDVRASISEGDALVAYVQYDRLGPGLKEPVVPSFMAFVQAPGRDSLRAVPLGPAASIDGLVTEWRKEAGSDPRLTGPVTESQARYRRTSARLRQAIWDPIAESIRGAGRIFIVPDGSLSLVNFGALPMGEDAYLVEGPALIHYLSAERDLHGEAESAATGTGLLAVGGPDFGASLVPVLRTKGATTSPGLPDASAQSTAAGGAAGSDPGGAPSAAGYRGPRAACGSLRSLRFGSLPASKAEARDVASLWKKGSAAGHAGRIDDSRVLRLTGTEADEATVKRLAPGRRVIHLATHGFFARQDCASSVTAATRGAGVSWGIGDEIGPILGDNPLLLSGLALAGANRRDELRPEQDVEDGMLSAEEIASMDLSGVEWVVLSGCETGVGTTIAGEGVFGLRRAFEIAGARTLIMSLWPVEDEAARAWMRGLYEQRLAGSSTADSVKDASVRLLKEQRRRGRTTHPFFWGSFVAAGDWR